MSCTDKRTTLSNQLTQYVEQIFGPDGEQSAKFATTISRAVVIPKAQKVGKTTFQTHSTHKVTEEYRQLAQEIEARLAAFTRETPPPESSVVAVPPAAVTEGNRVGEASPSNGTARPKVLRGLQLQPPTLRPDKLTRGKRVLFTQAEERELERLVSRVAAEVATPVKLSHVFRACVTLLRHAEDQIADHARQAGTLIRPSNGDPTALAEFEYRLVQMLSAAFRDAEQLW